jgi:hypothetical protein
MQRSVARLFYVGGYVSHPFVLDTSGTFIKINPLESELFKLQCRMSVSSIVSFSFLYSYLSLGGGFNTVGEDGIGLKLVPMRRLYIYSYLFGFDTSALNWWSGLCYHV